MWVGTAGGHALALAAGTDCPGPWGFGLTYVNRPRISFRRNRTRGHRAGLPQGTPCPILIRYIPNRHRPASAAAPPGGGPMPTSTAQHTSRIEAAITGGLAARSALAASWARSARLYRLDPAERQRDQRITAQELAQARESLGALLPTAAPHLDRLFQ